MVPHDSEGTRAACRERPYPFPPSPYRVPERPIFPWQIFPNQAEGQRADWLVAGSSGRRGRHGGNPWALEALNNEQPRRWSSALYVPIQQVLGVWAQFRRREGSSSIVPASRPGLGVQICGNISARVITCAGVVLTSCFSTHLALWKD